MEQKNWLPLDCQKYINALQQKYASFSSDEIEKEIVSLAKENKTIHEKECINLNPATNVLNPKAEAILSTGLGSRPSLGYAGDKYEMGLEAIEKIEVIASQLACEIFGCKYAEIRLSSGALANLYAFMATTKPGDSIIVPPASIGGHVTHHIAGCAGLYGLDIHFAPVDSNSYTVDVDGLQQMAKKIKPKLITIGGSLNLFPHPISEIRKIADEIGAFVHFDAAHLCGVIAGKAWQQPLSEGAHTMSFSTYKSLGGPAGGLLLTNDDQLAQKIDSIAFPGLTANFDVAKSASLAIALLDWREFGKDYARMMIKVAQSLANELVKLDIPIFASDKGITTSHQFALIAKDFKGGQAMAKKLRKANILTCGIGLPIETIEGDMNGLRMGTPEIVRFGMKENDMPIIAEFISQALRDKKPLQAIAKEVSEFRIKFKTLEYVR